MELEEILRQFAAQVGEAAVQTKDEGVRLVKIDDAVIGFKELEVPDRIVAWTLVGALPTEGRGEFLESVLSANFPFRAEQIRWNSFSVQDGELYLQLSLPKVCVDLRLAVETMHDLAEVAGEWRKRLAEFTPASPTLPDDDVPSAPSEDDAPPPGMMIFN